MIRKQRKNTEGYKCCNCGAHATQAHHIVPMACGGNDVDSNIAWLCDQCHDKIHGLTRFNGSISHRELIKKGLERAKQNGVHCGRKATTIDDIPLNIKTIYFEAQASQSILNISQIAREFHLSRNTIYKYFEILAQQ